ncbi:MAG: hypothetical protein WCZ89_01860 [Phycisphaerae bacterium]
MKIYLQPHFLICIIILAGASWGMSAIEKYFSIWFVKEPIALKKPLELLDEEKLKPFEVVRKLTIDNKDILKSLGTEDYIQWVLRDTEASPDSVAQSFMLFITYYDKPDSVPHVPEECYSGGGFARVSSDPIRFNVDWMPKSDINEKLIDKKINRMRIPGQYVLFAREGRNIWQPRVEFPVLYFFNVNGAYVNTRTEARYGLAKNIWSKHSYFSKVEFVFNQFSQGVEMQDAIEACEKLLDVLLPLLEDEHWPDIFSARDELSESLKTN